VENKTKNLLRGMIAVLGGVSVAASAHLAQAAGLAVPTNVEAHAASGGRMSISWDAAAEATSYNVYRSTTSGGEGTTPIGSTTSTTYTDSGLTSGPPTLYYYKVASVNGDTVSPMSAETASPTPPRVSPGSGNVAGVSGEGGLIFYGKDGLGAGFDRFDATAAMCTNCPDWFPRWLNAQEGALAPDGTVVDMAYADTATLSFNDVIVSMAGLYNIDFRYAFGSGLFPSVTNREMGLMVNGTVVTTHQRFPITGSFATYQHSFTQVQLDAGQNSLTQFAVSDHGISRGALLDGRRQARVRRDRQWRRGPVGIRRLRRRGRPVHRRPAHVHDDRQLERSGRGPVRHGRRQPHRQRDRRQLNLNDLSSGQGRS
jgi:hypothetical protein